MKTKLTTGAMTPNSKPPFALQQKLSWQLPAWLFCLLARRFQVSNIDRLSQLPLPGHPSLSLNFRRDIPIEEKMSLLEAELKGTNHLCLEIVRRILHCRRGIEPRKNSLWIYSAIHQRPRETAGLLSTRWIISVLDTFADHCPALISQEAMLVQSFFRGVGFGVTAAHLNLEHIENSAFVAYNDRRRANMKFLACRPVWDDSIYFNFKRGDSYANLFLRIKSCLHGRQVILAIYEALLIRMMGSKPFRGILTESGHFARNEWLRRLQNASDKLDAAVDCWSSVSAVDGRK